MFASTHITLGLITILTVLSQKGPVSNRKNQPVEDSIDSSYVQSIEKWRAERLEEVNGDDGWTTLIGLFWLTEGRNSIGSDPSNAIVLPSNSAPKFAGSLALDKGVVTLDALPETGITSAGKG